jgi:hypothetical protein
MVSVWVWVERREACRDMRRVEVEVGWLVGGVWG